MSKLRTICLLLLCFQNAVAVTMVILITFLQNGVKNTRFTAIKKRFYRNRYIVLPSVCPSIWDLIVWNSIVILNLRPVAKESEILAMILSQKKYFSKHSPKNEFSAAEDVVTEEYLLIQMNLFFWSR
jgi:hypothetical protein